MIVTLKARIYFFYLLWFSFYSENCIPLIFTVERYLGNLMKFEQGDKGGSPNPDCILEFDGMKDYHKKLPPHNPGWGIIFPSLGDLVRAVIGGRRWIESGSSITFWYLAASITSWYDLQLGIPKIRFFSGLYDRCLPANHGFSGR